MNPSKDGPGCREMLYACPRAPVDGLTETGMPNPASKKYSTLTLEVY